MCAPIRYLYTNSIDLYFSTSHHHPSFVVAIALFWRIIPMKYNFITIEGNIGAGKTTLAHLLAKKYDARLILEAFADNPFLSKF